MKHPITVPVHDIHMRQAMNLTRRCAALTCLLGLFSFHSLADTWPAKPIRMVVPFPAGGGTDIVARDVTQRMTTLAKWNFVVDNKPGSGGNLGIDTVAKAPADGYTLVIGQTSNLAINPTLYSKLPYQPLTDLSPIGLIGYAPLVLVVAQSSPYRTLAEVIQAAKAQPQALNYATSGNGTVAHLATELLQREAGVELTHVPYKGASQGLTDVIGGQVQLYMSSVPTLIGHIKSGKLRALAVTSAQRVDDLPLVPTVASARLVTLVSNEVWESATRAMTKKAMSSASEVLPPPEDLAVWRKRLSTMDSLMAALMLMVQVEEKPEVHFSSTTVTSTT